MTRAELKFMIGIIIIAFLGGAYLQYTHDILGKFLKLFIK